MRIILVFLALLILLNSGLCQNTRRGKKGSSTQTGPAGILDSVTNILFPGPSDAPILTRIFNKISYYASGIVISIVSYFAFFRNKKKRTQAINAFLGEWQQKIALRDEPFDEAKATKIIHQLNFKQNLKIAMKSYNDRISQNIEVKVTEAGEDSPKIFKISMQGKDPQGKSTLEGYASFAGGRMEMVLAQTHDKYQQREKSPIHYFEGVQTDELAQVMEGEWWVEGQRGTKGDYAGRWKFQY